MDLNGRLVLILGLGASGLASALWCDHCGARLRIVDTRAEPPGLAELQRRLGDVEVHHDDPNDPGCRRHLADVDLLVLSPGLSGGSLLLIHARASGIDVIGEIELFVRALAARGDHAPLLAISGTNGKTTTTALCGQLIAASGRSVAVAGNIGPAALTALLERVRDDAMPQAWVLELSSFQLESCPGLNASAAAMLNISADHLDRYIDIDDYSAAKARLFAGDGVQVLNRNDARVRRMALPGRRLITFGLDAPADEDDFGVGENRGEAWLLQGRRFLLPLSELPLAGLHNAANAMAALALCSAVGLDAAALLPALRDFRGLPHRVEKIAGGDGVDWYDDSKGTNVGATLAAIDGLGARINGKLLLIAGGDGKGQDFSPLAAAVGRHVRAVVLIGRDAPRLAAALDGCGAPLLYAIDMTAATQTAAGLAQAGDAVLLSPACASFDMFRDYRHRGEVFRAAVAALDAARA